MSAQVETNRIEDQFHTLKSVVVTLAVLRDGIRNASTHAENIAWQDIADMTLEYQVGKMNDALSEIRDEIPGLTFTPAMIESYSLLRKRGPS